MVRTLVAAIVAAAALATVAPAHAEPICAFHPICDDIDRILNGAVSVQSSHTICHRVEQQVPWLLYCYD